MREANNDFKVIGRDGRVLCALKKRLTPFHGIPRAFLLLFPLSLSFFPISIDIDLWTRAVVSETPRGQRGLHNRSVRRGLTRAIRDLSLGNGYPCSFHAP
jgi:hypothetical protein